LIGKVDHRRDINIYEVASTGGCDQVVNTSGRNSRGWGDNIVFGRLVTCITIMIGKGRMDKYWLEIISISYGMTVRAQDESQEGVSDC